MTVPYHTVMFGIRLNSCRLRSFPTPGHQGTSSCWRSKRDLAHFHNRLTAAVSVVQNICEARVVGFVSSVVVWCLSCQHSVLCVGVREAEKHNHNQPTTGEEGQAHGALAGGTQKSSTNASLMLMY